MNEQKRQAFLKAMDVQPYFPRQVLVGALPSPVYEFPASDAVTHELSEESAAVAIRTMAEAKVQGLDAIEELRSRSNPSRKAATVTAIRQGQQEAPTGDSESSAGAEVATGPIFNLRYYRITDELAVLDEIPPQGSAQLNKDSQKLMLAILRAVGPELSTQSLRAEEFSWPPQANYSKKHSPQVEAAKALTGFLQMRQETDGFTNLLVFAAQLEDVLLQTPKDNVTRDFDSDKGYLITVTHSLASMLAVATLKRDVWQHLQPLRKRLSSH